MISAGAAAESEARARGATRWLALAAAALLLVALGAGVAAFARQDARAIRFPYPLDYGEGPLLDQAVRLSHFRNIYDGDLNTPPYTISNYPPLYPLVQAPLVALFGPSLAYGRAIDVIALLAAALSLGFAIRALTGDRFAALAGGAMLLSFPYVLHWSALCRVDCLALGLSCAALALVVRRREGRAGWIGAAFLLAAAVYTRQSFALAAPFAAFVWLLRAGPRRTAFLFAAWTAGICIALFTLISLLTGGGFYFNIVEANINTYHWSRTVAFLREFLSSAPLLCAAGLLLILAGPGRDGKTRPGAWWLAAPYLVGSLATALTVGKSGSNVNYLLELCAALSLAAGAWLGRFGAPSPARIVVVLLLAAQLYTMQGWWRTNYRHRIDGPISRAGEIAELEKIVREADGPVIADEHMGLLPLVGKSIYYQPFEMKQLEESDRWNPTFLLESIRGGRFPVILVYAAPTYDSRGQRWSRSVFSFINQFYRPEGRFYDTIVYRPAAGGNG